MSFWCRAAPSLCSPSLTAIQHTDRTLFSFVVQLRLFHVAPLCPQAGEHIADRWVAKCLSRMDELPWLVPLLLPKRHSVQNNSIDLAF